MHIITTHENADFDGLASMIAAGKLYPDARLLFPGSREEALHQFIQQTLSYDYQFYTINQIDLQEVHTLTIVDAQLRTEIGAFAQHLEQPDLQVQIFDHHDEHSDINANSRTNLLYGSCTTILVELIRAQGLAVSAEEATIFALGIYSDTASFTRATTRPEDMQAAAWLLECGAKLAVINSFLRSALGIQGDEILHEIKQAADLFTIDRFPVTIASISRANYINEFSLLVKRYYETENLDTLFVLLATENRIHLYCLSRIADIDVGEIARELGGNGHSSAASARITGGTMSQTEEMLISLLHKHIQPQALAAEMMSQPVISIAPTVSLSEANAKLTRYNITSLPVLRAEQVVGIISRQVVEKALHHELGHLTVASYMSTEIESVGPGAPLEDIQELIVDKRQRLVPVMQQDMLLGIVTRTDLLNRLVAKPANLPYERSKREKKRLQARRRNLNALIMETIDPYTVSLLHDIGELADEIGFKAFAVGGFVRDLLLARANLDLDIVVEGDGIAFAAKVAKYFNGKYVSHEKFMTATVTLPNGFKLDIATARLEYYESPASMPMVQLSSIKLDLSRRDFTINAMALQLNSDQFGILIDYFNSQQDLSDGAIRVLHNLSFVEDPSRIFRAIRFATRMNFSIGSHTKGLIENAVSMNLFGKSRDSRFLKELKIICDEREPLQPLLQLAQFGLFQYLWPDLRPNYRTDRRFCHVVNQSIAVFSWIDENFPRANFERWPVLLLAIYNRSGCAELDAFCRRFSENNKNRKKLLATKQAVDNLLPQLYDEKLPPSKLFEHFEELSHEGLAYLCATSKRSWLKEQIRLYLQLWKDIKPELSGRDLLAMGYPQGPHFRTILGEVRAAKLDGKLIQVEDEIHFVGKHFPLDSLA